MQPTASAVALLDLCQQLVANVLGDEDHVSRVVIETTPFRLVVETDHQAAIEVREQPEPTRPAAAVTAILHVA